MADVDDLNMDDGDAPEAGAGKRKKGGLGSLLPTILKFAAIGIGALIFIVTVSVITHNIMRGDGRNQTQVLDPTSPYIGRRQTFAVYTGIGSVTTRTRDPVNHSVTVVVNLAYDLEDTATTSELNMRQHELRDFVRRYFTGKFAHELQPENEERLKREIMEILNTRYLDTAKIRLVLFDQLNVMEVF